MREMREPAVFSPNADKMVAFVVGFFGILWGIFMTTLVIYIWAGGGPPDERDARRRHAARVAMASGLGCLVLVILILFVNAANNHETVF
jgi:hypothetical protein